MSIAGVISGLQDSASSPVGKKFIIEAKTNSRDNVYIQLATLNGKSYGHNFLRYSDIVDGGIMSMEMSNKPALNRGLAEEDKPFSLSKV